MPNFKSDGGDWKPEPNPHVLKVVAAEPQTASIPEVPAKPTPAAVETPAPKKPKATKPVKPVKPKPKPTK